MDVNISLVALKETRHDQKYDYPTANGRIRFFQSFINKALSVYDDSGLTVREFCLKTNIPICHFETWLEWKNFLTKSGLKIRE